MFYLHFIRSGRMRSLGFALIQFNRGQLRVKYHALGRILGAFLIRVRSGEHIHSLASLNLWAPLSHSCQSIISQSHNLPFFAHILCTNTLIEFN